MNGKYLGIPWMISPDLFCVYLYPTFKISDDICNSFNLRFICPSPSDTCFIYARLITTNISKSEREIHKIIDEIIKDSYVGGANFL